MMEFAFARHSETDIRLVWWDGTAETELGVWEDRPGEEEMVEAALNHFNTSTELERAIVVVVTLVSKHVPERDLTIPDETMPWNG